MRISSKLYSLMNFTKMMNMNGIVLLKKTVNAWIEDKAMSLSAALAYYSIFSMAPLIVITMGLAGLLLGDTAISGQLSTEMKGYIGSKAAEAVETMVQSAAKPAQGATATIVGFVLLLFGASGVFGQLKQALNTIWKAKPNSGTGLKAMILEKFLNFGMVLAIGFLLLTSLLLSAGLAAFSHWIEAILILPAIVWTALAFIISFATVATLFALLFQVLPDVDLRWRDVWLGAVFTALFFEIGKTALGWYLGRESTVNAYGAAGSVVLLLLWVYYASGIFLFGAEFTRVYAQAKGRWIDSSESVPITPMLTTEALPAAVETDFDAMRNQIAISGTRLMQRTLKHEQEFGLNGEKLSTGVHGDQEAHLKEELSSLAIAFAAGVIPTLILGIRQQLHLKKQQHKFSVATLKPDLSPPAKKISHFVNATMLGLLKIGLKRHLRKK